jgi:copper transport protein
VVGAAFESVATTVATSSWSQATDPASWSWVVDTPPGAAAALRVLGGVALAAGAWHTSRQSPARALSAPLRSPALLAGVGLSTTAVVFDGHTVSTGNRFVLSLADLVHVSAGAVWAGGVLALAAVLTHRHRRGRDLDGLRLGLRFSTLAAAASVAAGVTGVAVATIVLDQPDQLVATPWGRTLLAKVVLVAAAASIGAYNHVAVRRIGPAASPGTEISGASIDGRLRRLVTIEAALLLAAIAVTALLVASSSAPPG